MLRLRACASLFRCSSAMSWKYSIQCVLSKHNAHGSTRYVGVCMSDFCVDESADEEGVIEDAGSIVVKFGSAPDCCPIKIDADSDDVSTFTGLPRACHAACRLCDFTPTWIFESSCCTHCNFSDEVALKARSWRLVDSRDAQ